MTQIDVTKDGQPWLTNQNTTNKAMWTRIQMAATAGRTLKIFPHKSSIPKPPAGPDLSPVRNLLVFATADAAGVQGALTLPPKWKILFSADPVYQPPPSIIQMVQAAGRPAWAWCDCRTTLPTAAKVFVVQAGLAGWYGQGENAAELDVCVAAGGSRAIVNLSALRPDQIAQIAAGTMLVTNENYRNVHPTETPDWRNANRGVGGNCGAVYGSATEGAVYTSARSQYMNGWFGQNDSWYVEGFTSADWQALRELG